MPRFICKFMKGDKAYYLEWSTVVDAPVTMGASLDKFKKWYRRRYGEDGMRGLDERLARVEAKGTSSMIDKDLASLVRGNRAGENEKSLSMKQIVAEYCK